MKQNYHSITRKINRVFAIIILLSCLCLSLFSYRMNRQVYLSELASQNNTVLRAIAQGIDGELARVEIITAETANDADIISLLQESRTSRQILSMEFGVSEKIRLNEAYLSQLSANMTILSPKEDILEDYNTLVREARLADNAFYRAFSESGRLSAWGESESAFLSTVSTADVLPFYHSVITGLRTRIGVVRCDVSRSRLFAPLMAYDGPGTMSVLRASGARLYAGEGSLPLRPASGQWQEEIRLYFGVPLDRLDAFLVLGMDFSAVQREAIGKTLPYTVMIVLVGVLLLIVTQYTVQAILSRLHSLTDAVSAIPEGISPINLPQEGPDEVGRLARAFSSLLERVSTYYDALLQKERDKRLAQSMALQYQINPHFLFNALYWLQLRMEEEGVDAALTESIEGLGKVLHYNLLGVGEVPLDEERAHILAYVSFVGAMKHFDIHLDVALPEALRDARILRFTLMPLLENAVQHGYIPGHEMNILISFSADADADRFEIAVHNDGKPIPPDRLEALQLALDRAALDGVPVADAQTGHGTALRNLARRLALTYEDAARITVESGARDTCVRIVLPLSKCLRKEDGAIETADRG